MLAAIGYDRITGLWPYPDMLHWMTPTDTRSSLIVPSAIYSRSSDGAGYRPPRRELEGRRQALREWGDGERAVVPASQIVLTSEQFATQFAGRGLPESSS